MAIDVKSSCEIWVGGSLLLKLHFFLYGKKNLSYRNIETSYVSYGNIKHRVQNCPRVGV